MATQWKGDKGPYLGRHKGSLSPSLLLPKYPDLLEQNTYLTCNLLGSLTVLSPPAWGATFPVWVLHEARRMKTEVGQPQRKMLNIANY